MRERNLEFIVEMANSKNISVSIRTPCSTLSKNYSHWFLTAKTADRYNWAFVTQITLGKWTLQSVKWILKVIYKNILLWGLHFKGKDTKHQSSSVQSLIHVWLFVTPWTAAHRLPCPSPVTRVCSNYDFPYLPFSLLMTLIQ